MNDKYMSLGRRNPIMETLNLFLDYPDQSFYGMELARKLDLSAGAIHGALADLYKKGLLERSRQGKTVLYFLNERAASVRSLKIIRVIEVLIDLVEALSVHAQEVYLFGSSAMGDYIAQSDIDLAVIAKSAADVEKINEIVGECCLRRPVQSFVFTVPEWEEMESKDPIFFRRIAAGINLYNHQLDELKFQEMP